MPRPFSLAAVALALSTAPVHAQPGASSISNTEHTDRKRTLERAVLISQIGTAVSATVLVVGGGLAAYKTTTMCDDYPDPADDCGVVEGLATAGTVLLVGVTAGLTITGIVGWVTSQRELEAMALDSWRPVIAPQQGGATMGVAIPF